MFTSREEDERSKQLHNHFCHFVKSERKKRKAADVAVMSWGAEFESCCRQGGSGNMPPRGIMGVVGSSFSSLTHNITLLATCSKFGSVTRLYVLRSPRDFFQSCSCRQIQDIFVTDFYLCKALCTTFV